MPLPPALSPEERHAALAKAAEARRQRAEVKERLKAGGLTLDELFAQGVRVRSLAGWGAPTAIRITVGSPAEVARLLAALARLPGVGVVESPA